MCLAGVHGLIFIPVSSVGRVLHEGTTTMKAVCCVAVPLVFRQSLLKACKKLLEDVHGLLFIFACIIMSCVLHGMLWLSETPDGM